MISWVFGSFFVEQLYQSDPTSGSSTKDRSKQFEYLDPEGIEIGQFSIKSGHSRSEIWSMVRRSQLYARTENGFVYIFSKKPNFKLSAATSSDSKLIDPEIVDLSKNFIERSVRQDLEQKTKIIALDSELETLKIEFAKKNLETQLLRQEIEDLETLNRVLLKTSGFEKV